MIVLTAPNMAQGRFSGKGQLLAAALYVIVARVDYAILQLHQNEVEQASAAAPNEKANIDLGRGNWPFDRILMR